MFDIARCIEMVILLRNSLQYSDLSSDNHSDLRSLDIYRTFYFTYMPSQVGYTRTLSGDPGITSQVHDEEVNFQFRPCLKRPGACSFPNTSLVLDTRRHRLMLGQPYRLSLSLELPESPENQVRVRGEMTESEIALSFLTTLSTSDRPHLSRSITKTIE